MGVIAPTPRPTRRAFLYAVAFFGAPLVGLLALFDIVLYFLFQRLFGICYGISCFF